MTKEADGSSSPRSALALAFHNMGMDTAGSDGDTPKPPRWSVAAPTGPDRANRGESPARPAPSQRRKAGQA